MKRKFRRKKI